MVNTIPPLSISLASLGKAPDQKVNMPSSLKMRVAHTKLFRYSVRASMDCMLCPGEKCSAWLLLYSLLQSFQLELTAF